MQSPPFTPTNVLVAFSNREDNVRARNCNMSRTSRELIVKAAVMLPPVSLDAPPVRAPVRAHIAFELRLRVHALELLVSPQGPLHRVTLAADRAHVAPSARFDHATVSLLMQRVAGVVSVHRIRFVRPRNS